MDNFSSYLLTITLAIIAALYASVGHAGASGYIAAMTLWGIAPTQIRAAALLLNILVSLIAFAQFTRAGYFIWSRLLPFALGSIPTAYIFAHYSSLYTEYSASVIKFALSGVLLFSAFYLFFLPQEKSERPPPSYFLQIFLGSCIGALSGLTGTGGGIFLTPLLILTGWANPRQAAATSAAFIFFNSIAGLFGLINANAAIVDFSSAWQWLKQTLPPAWPVAVLLGGFVGSTLGSQSLHQTTIKRLLALVLLLAGFKLLIPAARSLFL